MHSQKISDDMIVIFVSHLRAHAVPEANIASSLLLAACSIATTSLDDAAFIEELEICSAMLRRNVQARAEN